LPTVLNLALHIGPFQHQPKQIKESTISKHNFLLNVTQCGLQIHDVSLQCVVAIIKVAEKQIPLLYQNLEAYYTASHTGRQLQS